MMKKVICSFANKKFSASLNRLDNQIKQISFFDESFLMNEDDLDNQFIDEFRHLLIDGSRGYGYWVWKPYLILKVLLGLKENDTLLYVDAGCHINLRGRKRLTQYYNLLERSTSGIIAFQLPKDKSCSGFISDKLEIKDFYLQRNWTKGDLLDLYNVRFSPLIIDTPQVLAGIIIIKKCEKSITILNEWMSVFQTNFSLIDDSPSISPNLEGFIESRHDQSVFSILCKIHEVDLLSTHEIEGAPAIIANRPILAIRDIGNRMPYKSFFILRMTRILKSPYLFFQSLTNSSPTFISSKK